MDSTPKPPVPAVSPDHVDAHNVPDIYCGGPYGQDVANLTVEAGPYVWWMHGPYSWWMSFPTTFREPVKSVIVAGGLTFVTVISTLWGAYTSPPIVNGKPLYVPDETMHGFLAYLNTHWFYGLMGALVSGSWRGAQGYNKASAAASSGK
jgi:hypothetical protein